MALRNCVKWAETDVSGASGQIYSKSHFITSKEAKSIDSEAASDGATNTAERLTAATTEV
jgi:hypothetical protein